MSPDTKCLGDICVWSPMFAVGLLWVVVDRRRRSLQDIIFRTKVVYAWH